MFPWHTPRVPARPASAIALAALVAAGLAACGGDGGPDAERFCGGVQANPAAVVDPGLATEADLEATLDHYRDLGDLAPAAIAAEWDDLVVNLETASTVVPGDPESLQRALAQAYATEKSAVAVHDWLIRNCGVDLGPVATITPQGRVSPPTSPPTSPPSG